MSGIYGLMKKYGGMMAGLGYDVGEKAKLVVETPEGIFATADGAELANLRQEDIKSLDISSLPGSSKGVKAIIFSQTPWCIRCLREALPLSASLDDMAQIIGPEAKVADGRKADKQLPIRIEKALRRSVGCFVLMDLDEDGYGQGYTVTMGRNPYEAVTAMTVLEKSAQVTLLARKIGGAIPLPKLEAVAMRNIYKKKYSKAEETVKTAETSGGCQSYDNRGHSGRERAESDSAPKEQWSACEAELRAQLVEYGKKLVSRGLVQGTWGNLSLRLDDEYMLTTPSGLDYTRLTPADMVKVRISDLKYEGGLKPTSEKGLHAAIYKERKDIGSVIHTHSKYCSVFAAARKDMEVTEEYKGIFGDYIKAAKYALPGTKALMKNTVAAVGSGFGAIMSNHGMVACGRDLKTAYDNCVKMEDNAEKILSAACNPGVDI